MEHSVNNLRASQKGKKIIHSFYKIYKLQTPSGGIRYHLQYEKEWLSDKEINQHEFCELQIIVTEWFLGPKINNLQPLSLCDLSRHCKT